MKKNQNYVLFQRKILLRMKLTFFLLMLIAVQISASVSMHGQVTLNVQNESIRDVLREIENQSPYRFFYNEAFADLNKRVNINVDDNDINSTMDELLLMSDMSYRVLENNLVVIAPRKELQQHLVTGRVTDADTGEPIPGVTVMVQGTTIGTITDPDGNYNISVPEEMNVLQFSFVGMLTKEVVVEGRTSIDVEMTVDVIGIDEVVAVGYGVMRRSEVTGSVASVSRESFNRGPITQSPLQLVQGKIAGLGIHRPSGGDPTGGIQIQLRGISTIQGDASPLVIIDGVPGGNLNTVSPEDIASIDILRDGSAAAIYGTRGNAGVILITTEKGTPGRPQVSYSSYAYTETWFNKMELLDAQDWRELRTQFQNSPHPVLQSKAASFEDYGHDTDWMEEITRSGLSQVHNISISGGSENTSYHSSLSYRDLNGIIRRSNHNILNGRLNISHSDLEDRLLVQVSVNSTNRTAVPTDYFAYRQAGRRNPTLPVYAEDGSFHEVEGHLMFNPVALIEQFDREEQYNEMMGTTRISYEFLPDLRLSATGSFQRSNLLAGEYEHRESLNSIQGGYFGQATRSTSQSIDRVFESNLDYSIQFEGGHNLTAMAGYSYQDRVDESFGARNRNFIANDLGFNNLGAGLHVPDGNFRSGDIHSDKSSSKLVAFLGRINYNYQYTYYISASLRHEGSTRFGADHKWGSFPAISVGWTISNEAFMANANFVNDLRLRVGYGRTGNQGIPNYRSLERLSRSAMMLYQGSWIPGYAPASNPNPNLRWEKKDEINFGVDALLFNSSVRTTIDIYNRITTDLLYNYGVPVPPNLHSTMWTNLGEINNRGIEFSINAVPINRPNFSWNVDFNISYNQNELVSLSDDHFQLRYRNIGTIGSPGLTGVAISRLEEGQPIGNFYGYKFAGFTDDGKWQFWDETLTEKVSASAATEEDKKIIGNGLPKSFAGLSNTFVYGNFDLTINLRGAFGFDVFNMHRIFRENVLLTPLNSIKDVMDSPLIDDPQYSDYYIERGDYVKLDNITLGYDIPVERIGQARIYVSGSNLLMFTGYKGQDPETPIMGLSPGVDHVNQFPTVKTFTLGVNLIF